MVAQIPIPKKRLSELERYRESKFPAQEFKHFLCVWLRAESGMPTAEIARAVGLHEVSVRIIQRDFIARGKAAFSGVNRGGRQRQLMAFEEEAEFLKSFVEKAADASMLVANEVKAALEAKLGQRVHKTTVYRILKRNDWRKIMPRPRHPEQDKEAAEAFKKGATQKL
ncbi:MAG: winged helix-turn-helix domain-containing protein [Holophagaceae bacterium]|nr:winged helix-turn-helix domain-containing protein [Holophagaceae bacterium]